MQWYVHPPSTSYFLGSIHIATCTCVLWSLCVMKSSDHSFISSLTLLWCCVKHITSSFTGTWACTDKRCPKGLPLILLHVSVVYMHMHSVGSCGGIWKWYITVPVISSLNVKVPSWKGWFLIKGRIPYITNCFMTANSSPPPSFPVNNYYIIMILICIYLYSTVDWMPVTTTCGVSKPRFHSNLLWTGLLDYLRMLQEKWVLCVCSATRSGDIE